MAKKVSPAKGDKIDIGGKLPQFDAFAWFAYKELSQKNLDWIRIADPEALTLDDIQFATQQAILAYQVKWSNLEKQEPFSYTDFINLLTDFVEGWKTLTVLHKKETKPVIVNLLTNRPKSKHDRIKIGTKNVGSFDQFYHEVWVKIKTKRPVAKGWVAVLNSFKRKTKLDTASFKKFIEHFELHFEFRPHNFGISRINAQQQNEDLIYFSRLLFEEVAGRSKGVQFSANDIIVALRWQNRFKTTFDHELIIDKNKYQPIHKTIQDLNKKVDKFSTGYLFLEGGPGSGKSTLLTEWARNRPERIIKYYAFDFTNPSSAFNYSERGEAVNLYFDLVFQLKEAGLPADTSILYKDITVLRDQFAIQLNKLYQEYSSTGQRTIIIIDGLDHVPREYRAVVKTFLSELLSPSAVPDGVLILLGSQSYEMDSLNPDVKVEWQKKVRNIAMSPLAKKEVFAYIKSSELNIQLSEKNREEIFNVSQGHPLYLSYIVNNLKTASDLSFLKELDNLDGNISSYYKKLWNAVSLQGGINNFLGLICRIKGRINPDFISEWKIEEDVLMTFRKSCIHLFDEAEGGWLFFHNSFRQFLIYETAINALTGEFDNSKSVSFHQSLARKYTESKKEESSEELYHLYCAGDYESFIKNATPETFIEQLLHYRPPHEINDDIRLGIQIGKQRKDIYLVIRYLFAGSELQRRLYNLEPASFSKDFLLLKKNSVSKRYLRNNNQLLCSKEYAYKASRWFYQSGDKVEAKILYSLAEPEAIKDEKIVIPGSHQFDEIRSTIHQWASTAVLFEKLETILKKIENIEYDGEDRYLKSMKITDRFRGDLLSLCCSLLVKLNRWDDVLSVISKYELRNKFEFFDCFYSLHDAIESCLQQGNDTQAKLFLDILLAKFNFSKLDLKEKVYEVDMIYKVTGNMKEVTKLLKKIPQPPLVSPDKLEYDGDLGSFITRIKLNKLLNIAGMGVTITKAVPASKDEEEVVVVEFERMLCLITQVLSDGLTGKPQIGSLVKRLQPAIRFYYKTIGPRNRYWYRLGLIQSDYFEFLISSAAALGNENVKQLFDHFTDEFSNFPSYWSATVKRKILIACYNAGVDPEPIKGQLILLESNMLEDQDISGRIGECQNQVSAWIRVKEFQKAEAWIKKTIQLSTGIGYRKDYQFNRWIEWLSVINPLEPGEAKSRIQWFLSKLKQIKGTTENSPFYSAAESVLNATLQFNSDWGLQQMKWQLENGMLYFMDALEGTVKQSLEEVKDRKSYFLVQDIFFKLLLYYSENNQEILFRQFLQKGHEMFAKDFFTIHLPNIIESIKISALEEHRGSYFRKIYEFLEQTGMDALTSGYLMPAESSLRKSEKKSTEALTILPDHKQLSEEDVRKRLTSFDKFKELLSIEDPSNSYFEWSRVTDIVLPYLTPDNLKELIPVIKKNRRSTNLYSTLSKYATKLGSKTLAMELAEKALQSSSSSGWQKFYDGGTRLLAVEAFSEISLEEGTERGFIVFCNDIISTDYPSSYIEDLDDIIPVITMKTDYIKVWAEIEGYLKRLIHDVNPELGVPDLTDQAGFKGLPCELLIYLCHHPVTSISSIAKKIIVTYIGDFKQLQELVGALAKGSESDQEMFIGLMLSLQFRKAGLLKLFRTAIASLFPSNNFFISSNAIKLSLIISPVYKIAERKSIELSPMYSFNLSGAAEIVPEGPIAESGFVRTTDNPLELIKPFTSWLNILADKTGFEKINIAYRWSSIMREIEKPEKLTAEYEKSIRSNLRETDMSYPYPRPRSIIAERALMHLVSELCDAGELSRAELRKHLIFYDHTIDTGVNEIPRPSFIEALFTTERSYLPTGWVEHPSESKRLFKAVHEFKPGWFVIGEHSIQRSLNWGLATETYFMNLVFDGKQDPEDKHEIFGYVFDKTIESYYEPNGNPGMPHIIVINDNRFLNFDLKTNWIAFNSALALYLKWLPQPGTPFGWQNSNGEPMVQSVFWKSGNIALDPPKLESEAGEGWFVIISQNAIEELKSEGMLFNIEERVRRETKDEKRVSNEFDLITCFSF